MVGGSASHVHSGHSLTVAPPPETSLVMAGRSCTSPYTLLSEQHASPSLTLNGYTSQRTTPKFKGRGNRTLPVFNIEELHMGGH